MYFVSLASWKTISLVVLTLLFWQSVAEADDFSWQTHTYNADGNKGDPMASLVFGVPETDNVQFQAQCRGGSANRIARAQFSYHTGDFAGGARVDFFVSASPFSKMIKGQVTGERTDEGVTGIVLALDIAHPFWQALASARFMQYGLRDRGKARMGLSGSGPAVRKFLEQCKTIFAASNAGRGEPTKASQKVTCENFNTQSSKQSKTPVTVTFVNKSEGHRAILWIDFNGQPRDYAALAQGQSWTVKTYLTHPWMITDGPGNCLEMFMPKKGVTHFQITKPNRYFGPE